MRLSQTQPSSPTSTRHSFQQQHDQAVFENFYSTILDLKRQGILTDAQKKTMKEKLISNDFDLYSALANTTQSLKDNLIAYISKHFNNTTAATSNYSHSSTNGTNNHKQLNNSVSISTFSSQQNKPTIQLNSSLQQRTTLLNSQGSSLEVKTTRNNSQNPANVTSQNKPELGEFMKYLDDLNTNSPQKLTMFDKKQLQKIFKRLQQVVFDSSSPLPKKMSTSNQTSQNQLSPVKSAPVTFAVEDVLYLNRKYKEIKVSQHTHQQTFLHNKLTLQQQQQHQQQIYTDVQRVSQLFVSDSLAHPTVNKNTKLLLNYLLGVDSFCFISNQTTGQIVINAHQTANAYQQTSRNSRLRTDEDKILTPVQIKPSDSIVYEYARQTKDPEWLFFDSEASEAATAQKLFSSDQLTDEIAAMKLNAVTDLSELDPDTFPTIIAKFASPNGRMPSYKTFLFKFYNYKTETHELFSLHYASETSFYSTDKPKILTNALSLPVYLTKALNAIGMFLVQNLQQFNNLQESSIQIIDICNYFLNFGKNLLLDIFKSKLESCFNISAKLKIVENTPETQQQTNVEERSQLLSENQLLLEDDYSDIILDCSGADVHDRSLFTFFTEIQHYFGKYRQFLIKVNSRVFVYKFFLRSSYQTFLEISKKGQLKFISHVKAHSIELDHTKLETSCLSIQEVFKNNRRFHAEFQEILDFFNSSSEEQERINLRIHKEEESEKLKQQRNDQQHLTLNALTSNEDDLSLSQRPSMQNEQNSCLSPDILEKGQNNLSSNSHNNTLNAVNTSSMPNKSFVSSASKSSKPFKSYIKRGNLWFHLKSIADSQIYVELRSQQSEKASIGTIYMNIQDDFHSDSCTNFESFYQLDDILNSLNTSEFNDPRIKLVLKKLYSKVNSISAEEKVQKEYIDTQIELFTATHRERFTSTPVNFGVKHTNAALLASKFQSKSAHNVKSTISSTTRPSQLGVQAAAANKGQLTLEVPKKQLQQSQPPAQQQQVVIVEPEVVSTSILYAVPAVTNVDEWDFNVFELRSMEEKYTTTWNIIRRNEFSESFVIPEEVFANFIKELQKGYDYKNNEFHNFNHGISVMQSCFMLSKCKKAAQVLKKQDIFTVILSGLCHDVGHTGRTNNFEISIQSKLAIRYSDKSYIEEGKLGVEQTSFMKDLDVLHVMAKAEKGFLNVIVLPLWQSLNDFYSGELQSILVNLNDSIHQWGELSQQIPVAQQTKTELPADTDSVVTVAVTAVEPVEKKAAQEVEELNSAEEEEDDEDVNEKGKRDTSNNEETNSPGVKRVVTEPIIAEESADNEDSPEKIVSQGGEVEA